MYHPDSSACACHIPCLCTCLFHAASPACESSSARAQALYTPSPCHARRALHDRLCARTMAAAHSFRLSEDSWSSASCRSQAHNLGDKRRRSSVNVLGQGVQGASLRLHETCVCLSRGMEGSRESECGVPLQPLTSLVFSETGTPAWFEQETDRTCLDCN